MNGLVSRSGNSFLMLDPKSLNSPTRKSKDLFFDDNGLSECFTDLGFEVLNWDEQDAIEIQSNVQSLAKEDFSDDDCPVICVLTHGDANSVLYAKGM